MREFRIFDYAAKYVLDTLARFFPKVYNAHLGNNHPTVRRLADGWAQTEQVAKRRGEEIRILKETSQRGLDELTRISSRACEIALHAQARLDETIANNAGLVADSIGYQRQIREQEGELRQLKAENERLSRLERISLREQIRGKEPILILNRDGSVLVYNRAARGILGNAQKLKLSDYVSLAGSAPQIARIGDKYCKIRFVQLPEGKWRATISKLSARQEKFYNEGNGKNPYVAKIPRLPVFPLTPSA